MKKLLKKTALSLLISAAISSSALAAEASNVPSIFSYTGYTPYSSAIDVTETFTNQNAFSMDSGSLTFRFSNSAPSGDASLLGISDPTKPNVYVNLYINRNTDGDLFGIEVRNNSQLVPVKDVKTKRVSQSEGEFRTVTYVFNKEGGEIVIYVDGERALTWKGDVKFLRDVPGLSTAYVGKTARSSGNQYGFSGDVSYAGATNQVLTDAQVQEQYQALTHKEDEIQTERVYQAEKYTGLGAYKTERDPIFKGVRVSQDEDSADAFGYRIPSLLTTKDGVVIAAADKRYQHWSDWGNIDTIIHRSLDGGKTWQPAQTVIDLVSQPYAIDPNSAQNSAFLIDPLLVQDKNTGRVFMLVDMFPESRGFGGINNVAGEGNGYINIGGTYYQKLTDKDDNLYTIRENGVVYNSSNQPTDYRVIVDGNPEKHFKDLGDLYKGEERLGNIYLSTNYENNGSAPLQSAKTISLWLTHSDDNGATWSSPVNISKQVKKDWMRFLGTGPGTGLQLKDGSLVMPVYYTNADGKQSAALIISKDGGMTWDLGESPNDAVYRSIGGSRHISSKDQELTESQVIQLDNGDLKLFSRNYSGNVKISTSKDGGYTWDHTIESDQVLLDSYCQMSVIKYSKRIDGKEYVVFANAHSSKLWDRTNGKAWLGEVQEDGSIKWKYNTSFSPAEGTKQYAYNSLTELPDGSIGILYESHAGYDIQYVRFNLEDLFWQGNYIYRDLRDETYKDVTLNSPREETFYKIGDGEMIKVGKGKNLANLEVREGIATLNQQADDNGAKQAYANVTVKPNATVRLADSDQINFSNLTLEQGANLDLNGADLTVKNGDERTGLRAETINGNIVNNKANSEATFSYQVNGNHIFTGVVGNGENGNVSLVYAPEDRASNLTLANSSFLNMLDVQAGSLIYGEGSSHVVENATLHSNSNLILQDNVGANIKHITLENAANLIANVTDNNATQLFTDSITGEGNLIKQGTGALFITGNINHTGKTDIQEGAVELQENAQLGGSLTLASGTKFGGQGSVKGDSTWSFDSSISPSFNSSQWNIFQRSAEEKAFAGKTLTFGNVVNQGADVNLIVDNKGDDITQWKHDALNITGDYHTENPTLVNLLMLGTNQGVSDKNNNGRYDADEGLSLIKVYGNVDRIDSFALGVAADKLQSAYQFELVSFEKGRSGNFYDYQLHRKLIKKDGTAVNNVVYAPLPDPLENSLPNDLIITAVPDKAPTLELPNDLIVTDVPADSPTVELPNDLIVTAVPDEAPTLELPNDLVVWQVLAEGVEPPTLTIEEAPASVLAAAEAEQNVRAQLREEIPSYLVANTAVMHQGTTVRDMFTDNLWAKHQKGFYVEQRHTRSDYKTDLGFVDYGYDYESIQNTTLFGSYMPVSDSTELHAGLAFSNQKVTPKAVDGYSSTKYKSTSLLLAMHNEWDNVLLNSHLGIHWHDGKVSTNSQKNIAKIKGEQYQVGTELGYKFKLGQFSITPVAGLSYQYFDMLVTDKSSAQLKVNADPFKVFSQHVGSYFGWENDYVDLSVGALYEHHNESSNPVVVNDERFNTGSLDNAVVAKANADFKLTPNFKIGIQVNHRHSVSDSKVKQTNIGAKLEYQF
ncbi:exo-alpha-sialidase [Lonepinella sp. MS14435]|uniref:exo-alpha-sialidase n=1 Tax=Lonepinella sp. MS14435 TaxID=3003618 RepID=UPI0036D8483C